MKVVLLSKFWKFSYETFIVKVKNPAKTCSVTSSKTRHGYKFIYFYVPVLISLTVSHNLLTINVPIIKKPVR